MRLISTFFFVIFVCSCSPDPGRQAVVVYTSVDDAYARMVAEKFQIKTGIEVLLVTDTEETKSTGLVNRLIAEKARPQADVFWSGDPARPALLKRRGITTAYKSAAASSNQIALGDLDNHYTALSARLRVLIYNRALVPAASAPHSIFDLASPVFRGRACIANPLFGTTSMHVAALFSVLGEERAFSFFGSLASNNVAILSSNGEVKRRVAAGDFAIGLTDSDDVSVALQDGKPVGWVIPDQKGIGALLIPNAVCLIKGGPHPDNGAKFVDFLLSEAVEIMLANSAAVQIPLRENLPTPAFFPMPLSKMYLMPVNCSELVGQLENATDGYVGEWTRQQMELGRSRAK